MKVKLDNLVKSSFEMGNIGNQPLPAGLTFKIVDVIQVINPKLEAYEKAREAAKGDKDQIDKLLETEVEINVEQISLAELSAAKLTAFGVIELKKWLVKS